MGKTRYKKIIELLNNLKIKYGNEIKADILIKEIKINIGSDRNRTLRNVITDLRDLNLIEEKEDVITIR